MMLKLILWDPSKTLVQLAVVLLWQMGLRCPSAVQAACIGPTLAGRDVMGCAETGSGDQIDMFYVAGSDLSRLPYVPAHHI